MALAFALDIFSFGPGISFHLNSVSFGGAAIFSGALLAMWVKWLGVSDPITESFLAEFLLGQFPLVLALLPGEFDSIRSFFQ